MKLKQRVVEGRWSVAPGDWGRAFTPLENSLNSCEIEMLHSYVFSERERSLYGIARPSVCRLTVTFMRPTQAIEIFGNVSTPFGTLAIYDYWIKILRRSS